MVTTHMYRSKGHQASCVISAIPAVGHVYDISIPDSFVYTYYRSCIYVISILWLSVVYTIGSPLKEALDNA